MLSTKSVLASVACLAVFCFLASGSMESGSSPANSSSTKDSPKSDMAEYLAKENGPASPREIKQEVIKAQQFKYTWSTDGVIMKINVKIQNLSSHSYKDFEITCNHFAPSGTKIDSNTRTIYETVKANGRKSIQDFNMGFINSQASSSNCSITDLVPLD